MQTYWNSAYFYRILYNVTKLYSSQLETAEQFNQLQEFALNNTNKKDKNNTREFLSLIKFYFVQATNKYN